MDAFPRSIESKIPAAYCFFNSFLIHSPFAFAYTVAFLVSAVQARFIVSLAFT